ncbi:hypothetical protein ACIQPT_31700 [Streptomyces sp. NPDC091289]|uniref:hypothetical protein n=1 Tax=Streptomyces sp. NPDC091289 TaxID=3365989 RepID=UPI0038044433
MDTFDDAYATASGAYGLADQIAPLRWTRDNIARSLLGCPDAQGLFQRAVSQSAAGAPVFSCPARSAWAVDCITLAKLGVAARDLPTVGPDRIPKAQSEIMSEVQRGKHPECGRMTIPFVPLTSGDLLPRPPYDAIADGVGTDVELSDLTKDLDGFRPGLPYPLPPTHRGSAPAARPVSTGSPDTAPFSTAV